MWLDIAVAVFLIICIFRGDKRGFVLAFISTFGWVISLAGGYILKPKLILWLDTNTTMRHDLHVKITEYFVSLMKSNASGADAAGEAGNSVLPDTIKNALDSAANKVYSSAAQNFAEPVTDIIVSLAAFFILVFAIKIIMYLFERIVRAFSKKDNTISSINSIAGMIFNLIRGCIVSYIIILLIMMVALVGNIQPALQLLKDSFLVTVLADSNLLPFSSDILTGASLAELFQK